MTKVTFFGASVTAQNDGYVSVFQKLVKEIDINVFKHSYGGMHLGDAGISFIDTILKDSPDYIFLDWFSTAINYEGQLLKTYLDVLVRKSRLQNCTLHFLLLDANPLSHKKRKMYAEVIRYAEEYKIYYTKLYDNPDITDLLRDNVHTNSKGSEFYGNRIFEDFSEMLKNPLLKCEIPEQNKYCDISFIDIDKTVEANIYMEGSFLLIGIYQDIGPFSGLIEKYVDSNIINERIWDIHCHYTRKSMKINTSPECKNIKINVLQENFDTSTCRRVYDFTGIKKYLRIFKIFYIGNISSISIDGNNIPFIEGCHPSQRSP
jgi:hypothetical protein